MSTVATLRFANKQTKKPTKAKTVLLTTEVNDLYIGLCCNGPSCAIAGLKVVGNC